MKLKSESYFTLELAVQYPVGENPFIFGEKLSKVGKEFRSEISACFICQTRAGNWSQTPTFSSTEWCAFYSPQGWHCSLTWHQCGPRGSHCHWIAPDPRAGVSLEGWGLSQGRSLYLKFFLSTLFLSMQSPDGFFWTTLNVLMNSS